jgi:inosine/xanthosine triphosphate pyrophosphatase family protein
MKELNVTFVTGSVKKKEYLEKLLGLKIKNQKVDLDEIQSLNVKEIIKHKVVQAYKILKTPVLVEDTSLEFEDLSGLPGPFIRFFVDNVPMEKICNMIGENRNVTARCVFGYFDGEKLEIIEGSQNVINKRGYRVADFLFLPYFYNRNRHPRPVLLVLA